MSLPLHAQVPRETGSQRGPAGNPTINQLGPATRSLGVSARPAGKFISQLVWWPVLHVKSKLGRGEMRVQLAFEHWALLRAMNAGIFTNILSVNSQRTIGRLGSTLLREQPAQNDRAQQEG